MGKICKDLFRNFPDFKGIKTHFPYHLCHLCKFRNVPDFKGIKTSFQEHFPCRLWFRNFPDFKGIKTRGFY